MSTENSQVPEFRRANRIASIAVSEILRIGARAAQLKREGRDVIVLGAGEPISRERIQSMRDGAILVNTARGALVDEQAMIDALQSGKLAHAGLDVFVTEPMPKDHPLTKVENVTLSAHSAFRTPEASDNLIQSALNHCRRVSGQGAQQ